MRHTFSYGMFLILLRQGKFKELRKNEKNDSKCIFSGIQDIYYREDIKRNDIAATIRIVERFCVTTYFLLIEHFCI